MSPDLVGVRDQLRRWTAAYVLSAIVILGWPDRSGWTNVTVLALWLCGAVVGDRLWVTIVERRRWWAIDVRSLLRAIDVRRWWRETGVGGPGRRPERRAIRRLRNIAFLVAWMALLFWQVTSPIHLQIPVDAQGRLIPPTRNTFDHLITVDVPQNMAGGLILVAGMYLFTIALGSLILAVAEASRRDSKRHAQPPA
jgi:hypothetical protein